jgi:hypothetical protein
MTPAREAVAQLPGLVEAAAAVAEELHHGSLTTIRATEATRTMEATARAVMEVMAMANKATVTRAPDMELTETAARTTDTKTSATKTTVATAAINLLHLRHQLMFRLRLLRAIFRRPHRLLEQTDCLLPGLPKRLGCL